MKIQKKKLGVGGGRGGGGGRVGSGWRGVQGGCERRIKVFVKIQKKHFLGVWVGGVQRGGGGWGRVGWGGGEVRVDVNEELKLL